MHATLQRRWLRVISTTVINDRWVLNLPEHRHKFWTQNPGWEADRLEHMSSTIGPHSRVLYIGAEEGDMPGLCASWGAELFMVEPNPRVWPNIKAIWDANEFNQPGTYAGFCGSDATSHSPLTKEWPSCADGPIITDHAFPSLKSAGQTPITTVDQLGFWAPNVLVIDVEGAEWDVLFGGENTLRQFHPDIYLSLHPEFMWHDYQHYSADLRYWLSDVGYQEKLIAYPPHEVHLYYTKRP